MLILALFHSVWFEEVLNNAEKQQQSKLPMWNMNVLLQQKTE